MQIYLFRALPWALAISVLAAPALLAKDAVTNDLRAAYTSFQYALEEPARPDGYWSTAVIELGRDQTAENRIFSPLAHSGLFHIESRERYLSHATFNSLGKNVVIDTLANATRESFGENLPLERWQDWFEGTAVGNIIAHSFIWNLVEGSIGNTSEEELQLVSAATSEIAVSRWQQIERQFDLEYGLRETYGYLSASLGHQPGGLPLARLDSRLRLSLPAASMSGVTRMLKLEGQLTFPLPGHNQFVIGGSIYPEQYAYSRGFDGLNYGPAASARFEHIFTSGNLYGVAALGASVNRRNSEIVAQFSIPLDLWHRHVHHLD